MLKTRGLKNCGGTCYFNSFLQLFFNIQEIQEYFKNYKILNINDINDINEKKLKENCDLNNLNFIIEDCAISKIELLQKDWITKS